jgi:hypothetical protein
VAWRLIHENIEAVGKVISLTLSEYRAIIKRLAESGLIGGIVYVPWSLGLLKRPGLKGF